MRLRKALSIILAVCMVLSSVSVAYAAETPEITETEIVGVEETVTEDQEVEVKIESIEEVEEAITEDQEVEAKTESAEEKSEADEANADAGTDDNEVDINKIQLKAELEDVTVTLDADADAFDNKGELSLKVTPVEITDEEEKKLDGKETENVAKRVTYDITVLDDGEEIEPVKDVTVSFELKDAPSGADGVNIYHHDGKDVENVFHETLNENPVTEASIGSVEDDSAANVQDADEVSEEELEGYDDVVIIDDVTVDSFSYYTIDFTYKDKTVSINGDTTANKLDDIVAQLGITEKVEEAETYQKADCTGEDTDGEVKNAEGETLFTVYESEDTWYVDAENAFQTEHGLVIKTADGAEYKIKVTDALTETNIKYIDVNGVEQTCSSATVVSNSDLTWGNDGNDGWYVVDGTVDYTSGGAGTNGIKVNNGDVHLILKDGCILTVKGVDSYAGICVTGSNSLTIYGQSGQTGTLTATGGKLGAGIGGDGSGSKITINGGKVTATGGKGGAGIGGGDSGSGSNITINGGTVTAKGGSQGAGIGGGKGGSGSNITINGGVVTANGSMGSAGIGGGGNGGSGSNITINGGVVTANGSHNGGSDSGAGIGGGNKGNGSKITINGGKVTATGGKCGAGIGGGGNGGSGSNIIAAASVVVKAGDSENPTTVISHDNDTDLSTLDDFKGKQYVTAEEPKPEPDPEPDPEPEQKSSGSSSAAWTSVPTAYGSSTAPINNGTWGNGTTGTWQYKVNGETLKNATAWISYTGADGKPYTGCFYFDKNGNMATNWQKIDNIWYFFDTTPGSTLGMMKTSGWITTDGKQYYVGADGKMLANTTTPDGHKVDATGARID